MTSQYTLPQSLFIDMERSGPVPLYYQIATRIERAIVSGDVPSGSRIDNEVAISDRLGVSRPTIRRAIQELVDKGFVVRRRGIGTQVVHGSVSRSVELTSLFEDLENASRTPSTEVLLRDIVPAEVAIAERLGLDEGTEVLHIRRRRLAGGVPIAVLENYLPKQYFGITMEDLIEHGLYQLLRAQGANIRVARETIGARNASHDEVGLLDLERAGAVLTMNRIAYSASAVAVEYGNHIYRPDLYSFDVTLVSK